MKIIKYTPNKTPGSKVLAFFDIAFDIQGYTPGTLEVKGFKLIDGEKGKFIGSPSKKYEKDGEVKYQDDVWITEPLKGPMLDLVLNHADPIEDIPS